MNSSVRVDLFAEDRAHEALLRALIERVGAEENCTMSVQVRSARGGHARAISEFGAYQLMAKSGMVGNRSPDLVVVAIDGNCTSFAETRSRIHKAARSEFEHLIVAACPDPHVERWFLADPESFFEVVGLRPTVGARKCEREHYKQILRTAIANAGHPPTLEGIEFASELVRRMDFFRAGKADSSLKSFLDDLRDRLQRLTGGRDQEGVAG